MCTNMLTPNGRTDKVCVSRKHVRTCVCVCQFCSQHHNRMIAFQSHPITNAPESFPPLIYSTRSMVNTYWVYSTYDRLQKNMFTQFPCHLHGAWFVRCTTHQTTYNLLVSLRPRMSNTYYHHELSIFIEKFKRKPAKNGNNPCGMWMVLLTNPKWPFDVDVI